MKYLIYLFMFYVETFFFSLESIDGYNLVQNKPVEVGTIVTFSIEAPEGSNPFIAWDFGDGTGLGRYKRGLSVSYRFNEIGVYQVFARIQGEEIPLTVTQTVHKPLGNLRPSHSSTIVIDTALNNVWVVNPDNHSVSCLDALDYHLKNEISVGKHPRTLALDSNSNLWVTNEDDATISIINFEGVVEKVIELPYASRPYGICFDPLKEFVYVTLQGTGEMLKINSSYQIIDQVNVGRSPRGIAISANGDKIYVSQFISPEKNGVVREVDALNMTLTEEIILAYDETIDFEDRGRGVPNFLSSLTITPDGSELWVPSKKDNISRGMYRDGLPLTFENTVRTIVSKIKLDSSREDLSSRVDINDADLACAVEFSPYGNIAFIALQGVNKIAMLNTETNSRFGVLDSLGLAPQGMVFNADGTRLYVQSFMSRSITVFDTEDIILSNSFASQKLTTTSTVLKDSLPSEILKGKQIFYNAADERMTFAGYISCATCHLDGGSDERVWDFTERGEGLRNTQSLLGRGGIEMGRVHWTSNFDEIQDFENDIRNGFGGKGFMTDDDFFTGSVSDPLGDPKAGISPDLDALSAYITSLNKVNPSPFRNQDGSLTQEGLEGMSVFYKAGCQTCHAGRNFTDRTNDVLHDVGTISNASGKRRELELTGFGTPTLKGVWETAPYLHDGSATTLMDVLLTKNIDNKHGNLSSYSNSEIDNLVSFLLQIDESENDPLTGVEDVLRNPVISINVSPNPAKDKLRIKIEDATYPYQIKIYSLKSGEDFFNKEEFNKEELEIDVSGLNTGVYIVYYQSGNVRVTEKFLID